MFITGAVVALGQMVLVGAVVALDEVDVSLPSLPEIVVELLHDPRFFRWIYGTAWSLCLHTPGN